MLSRRESKVSRTADFEVDEISYFVSLCGEQAFGESFEEIVPAVSQLKMSYYALRSYSPASS